jgi:uncharacterized membrane protein HdeD (DUF308 family)
MTDRPGPYGGEGTRYQTVERTSWSVAQVVALLAGLLLVVMGGVALAKGGVHFDQIHSTYVTVAGLGFTCLSASVQIVAGIILLAGVASARRSRSVSMLIGLVLLPFGIVVALEPSPFFNLWGYKASNGVYFLVLGAALVIAAFASPIVAQRVGTRRRAL